MSATALDPAKLPLRDAHLPDAPAWDAPNARLRA